MPVTVIVRQGNTPGLMPWFVRLQQLLEYQCGTMLVPWPCMTSPERVLGTRPEVSHSLMLAQADVGKC